jgi:hypothetical protein
MDYFRRPERITHIEDVGHLTSMNRRDHSVLSTSLTPVNQQRLRFDDCRSEASLLRRNRSRSRPIAN